MEMKSKQQIKRGEKATWTQEGRRVQ